jgi:hypothetical protein
MRGFYYGVEALIRLDLATGRVTQTLRPGEGFKLYTYSFSDDDHYLAYFRTWLEHPILNIQNLITGEEQHFPLGEQFSEAGSVIWSPDKSRVAFSARTIEDCEHITYYVVMMKLADASQTILFEGPTANYNPYIPIEWTSDNEIILDMGYSVGYGSLNIATSEITPFLTPTPSPVP